MNDTINKEKDNQTLNNQKLEMNHTTKSSENTVDVNAENKTLNKTVRGVSKFGILGFLILAYNYSSYWEQWEKYAPENYKYPSLYDAKYVILWFLIIFIIRLLIEKLSESLLRLLLQQKYKENEETEATYLKLMKSSLFKTIWYIFIVSLGYSVITELEFFPKDIFGNGDLATYYDKGAPYTIFIKKP